MKLYNIIRRLKLFVPAMALAVLASCQDDLFQELDYTSSGEDVTVTIPISMPEMTPQSRADIGDNQLTQVNSLWIAVFNATTGDMTSQNDQGEIGWYEVLSPSNSGYHDFHPVTLNAKTGPSYIIAVANVENPGIKKESDGTFRKAEHISELLKEVKSWKDFLSIGASAPSDLDDVNAPSTAPLTMSGCYRSHAAGTHPSDWANDNFIDITIPNTSNGTVTFSKDEGAIHLRRIVSHITFNVSIGKEATDIIDAEVLSYRVCNIPKLSWLYERGTDVASTDGTTNIGDNASDYDEAETDYQTAITFPTQYISNNKIENNSDPATFDFWIAENKHTGHIATNIDTFAQYNLREAKTGTEPILYTSLTGQTWTTNNMATYVVLTCNVTYRDRLYVDADGYPSEQETSEVYRTGVAEYTVHLGYINNVANDFNSYRNSDYTYNVTITGLESIRLEAVQEGYERNAAEGVVTDVVNPTVILDSHPHTFNIVLTEEELIDNAEQLGYIITTYESGNAHTFTNEQYRDQTADNPIAAKYMNWVEIKPTGKADVFADYIPAPANSALFNGHTDADRVMTIQDFIDLIKYEKPVNGQDKKTVLNQALNNDDGNYYFTVFINEYSYEIRYGESGNPGNAQDVYGKEDAENRWTTYINQNPRRFYLQTQKAESTDGNSIYSRSKYAVQQRSMQSFYSMTDFNDNKTAFAIEHINETQGLNMRVTHNPAGLDNDNGRYNVWNWVGGDNGQRTWNTFVSLNSPQQIPNVNEIDLQGGPAIASVNAMNPAINNPSSVGFTHLPTTVQLGGNGETSAIDTSDQSAYDPQPESSKRADYIEAINACMNRNRDENGNGIIDAPELKWYVPASGKYLRAIIGRASLTNPIMPYDQVKDLPKDNNALNSRYLVYASNNYFLWAMEGLATSPLATNKNSNFLDHDEGGDIWMQPAWQVRCIRNLGTDLTTVSQGEKVIAAYKHDDTNREIILTNYDPASIRQTKYTGAGNSPETPYAMTIHPVTSEMNRLYPAFQYTSSGSVSTQYITFNYKNTAQWITRISGYEYITTINPCSTVTEGGYSWRLPNQKELAIMRNLGVLGNLSGAQYALSCTYDYYDITGKNGGSAFLLNNSPNHYFMGSRADGGTRLSAYNLDNNGRQVYIRCVRDIDP